MNPRNDESTPDTNQNSTNKPNPKTVIQPSVSFKAELENLQQTEQRLEQQPNIISPEQPQIPQQTNTYSSPEQPAASQMQYGMSASQMGYNQPKSGLQRANIKGLLLKGLVGIVLLVCVLVALMMTNVIAFTEFKTVNYTNSNGKSFALNFYSKHGSRQLKSGNTQLVSKVSKDGKFPLVLSISSGDLSNLNKNGIKNCSGSLSKAFDVRNNNLNQTIPVCIFPSQNGEPAGTYIAGFGYGNQAHIITISQDLSKANVSSQNAAQDTLTKFGISEYNDDIKKIVASIKAE